MDAHAIAPPLTALRNNLVAGLRLATGMQVRRNDFIISFDQGLGLMLCMIGLEVLIDTLGTEHPARYSGYGLNYLAALYLFDLMVVLLVARLAGASPRQTGGLVIANLAFSPVYLLISHLLTSPMVESDLNITGLWLLWLLPVIWQLLILIRLLQLFIDLSKHRALSLAILYIALGITSFWLLPPTQLWYSDEPEATDSPYARLYELSVEDLYYDQPQLLQSALADIEPQRPGVTDLYLLAMGGYGLEKVFLNEVAYVRQLFDERFDTRGHSLILVNNVDTVHRYPLANRHNLRDALTFLGSQMDSEEDVLFLFMTSHGSKNHRFSVNFGPVRLDDLTPQQLRQALDDAGIHWRVILVSSCYSGGFIEPLKDPNTLIMTAAAADRTSFGCGADSEFTDFGTAYFKHGLVETADFVHAFDLAEAWVSDKEQQEKRRASLPQRYLGAAISAKLDHSQLLQTADTDSDTCEKASSQQKACHSD
ncbi:MAG: C13 family peptidase, partial [Candidatus Thiodiazotropha sp.]